MLSKAFRIRNFHTRFCKHTIISIFMNMNTATCKSEGATNGATLSLALILFVAKQGIPCTPSRGRFLLTRQQVRNLEKVRREQSGLILKKRPFLISINFGLGWKMKLLKDICSRSRCFLRLKLRRHWNCTNEIQKRDMRSSCLRAKLQH